MRAADDQFTTALPVCYEVLLFLNSRMAKLAPGAVLDFRTPDPGAQDEIPPWCELRGYTLLSIAEIAPDQPGDPVMWRYLIRR